MTIETPEFLALQEEHKALSFQAATLKSDLDAAVNANTELSAKLTQVQANLAEAEKANAEIKANAEKAAAEHEAALADFNSKVELAASAKMAAIGVDPVKLGKGSVKSAAEIYDEFKAASPVKARQMFSDPSIKAIITEESARRMTA